MNNKEMLSVFMDGELQNDDAVRVIKQLRKNDELKSCWEQYHLIGDCIRSQFSSALYGGFADRFATLLESEPHHFGRPAAVKHHSPKRFNDKAGFALAASISAVALLGMLQVNQQELVSAAEMGPVAYETDIQHQIPAMAVPEALAQAAGEEAPVVNVDTPALAYASFDSVDTADENMDVSVEPSVEDSVYDYLVNYSQYAVSAPLQGTVPAATLISYYTEL